jgi:type I restriction enzyme S subunit
MTGPQATTLSALLIEHGGSIKTGPFGTTLKAAEYSKKGVPVVSVGEIGHGTLRISETTPKVGSHVVQRLPEYVLRAGDIVFGRKGAVDRCGLIREFEDGYFLGSDGIRVRLGPTVDPRFVAYQFQTSEIRSWLVRNSSGTTMASLNQEILGRVPVRVPPLPEQKIVSEALEDVDDLIAKLERLIAKKRAIKQGMMQQLLTGRSRFSGFNGPLPSGFLGGIADVIMGQSPEGASYNRDGAGVPLINGPTEFTDRHPVVKQWTTDPVRFCEPEDILICVRGSSTGRMNVADRAYCIGRGIAAVRAKGRNDQNYVRYALDAVVTELLKLQSGSTFPSIDSRVISGGRVLLPEPSEQRSIGEALSDVADQLAALHARLDKARDIKAGMMQQLLTGRIRLPVEAAS